MMKNGRFRRRYIVIPAVCVLAVISAVFLLRLMPQKDVLPQGAVVPAEYMPQSDNHVSYQTGNECSAYAAAYVLRHFGTAAEGSDIYPQIRRYFGFVPAASVAELFRENGLEAAAYSGSIDTLKYRISQGAPAVVFISIPGDTHYAAAVGYDEQYIYLADSLPENANADGGYYNRRVSTEEFQRLWRTDSLFGENIYIVAEQK